MKSITVMELVLVIVILVIFSGLGYCIYMITDMKYQVLMGGKLGEMEQWRNEVTILLNYNIAEKRLIGEVYRNPQPKQKDKEAK